MRADTENIPTLPNANLVALDTDPRRAYDYKEILTLSNMRYVGTVPVD